MRLALAVALFGSLPAAAIADPCEAPPPRRGETFAGPVRYVVDGDGFCLGPSSDPATWIEVRLQDFYAPELDEPEGRAARAALVRITRGKVIRCVAGRRSYDRVVARCTIDGRPLGALMRAAGVAEGGRGR